MVPYRLIACGVALVATLCIFTPCPASAADEATVKAGFLYNFARFVKWPASAFADGGAPIVFGILGDDPIGNVLDDAVRKRAIQGRKGVIKRFASGTAPSKLRGCHILLISRSESAHIDRLLAELGDTSVFTVGDAEGFARRGGMLSFRLENSRLALDLNLEATRVGGLEVSAQLQQVARIVKTEP